MTRSEACEILGISENASLTMAKSAYKILKAEATTKVQEKVYATALNVFQGVLKGEGDHTESAPAKPVPRKKPTAANAKPTPNVPAAKTKPSTSLRAKSRDVATQASTAVSFPQSIPANTSKPSKIEPVSFEGLPQIEPSRVYRAVSNPETFSGFIKAASKTIKRQLGPTLRNWSTAILPGERHFLSAGETGCYKWDLHTGEVLSRIGSYNLYDMFSVRVSADGKHALVTGISNGIEMLDVETGKKVAVFGGHTDWTRDAIFLPGEQEFVSVGWDGKVIRWNISTGTKSVIGELSGSVLNQVEYLPALEAVATVCGNGVINTWNIDGSQTKPVAKSKSRSGGLRQAHTTFATSSDGKLAISCTDGWYTSANGIVTHDEPKCLTLWTLGNEPVQERRVPLPYGFEAIALCPKGKNLLTGKSHEIYLWDAESMRPTKKLSNSPGINSLNFAPSGDFVLGTGVRPDIMMWRL